MPHKQRYKTSWPRYCQGMFWHRHQIVLTQTSDCSVSRWNSSAEEWQLLRSDSCWGVAVTAVNVQNCIRVVSRAVFWQHISDFSQNLNIGIWCLLTCAGWNIFAGGLWTHITLNTGRYRGALPNFVWHPIRVWSADTHDWHLPALWRGTERPEHTEAPPGARSVVSLYFWACMSSFTHSCVCVRVYVCTYMCVCVCAHAHVCVCNKMSI